MQYQRAWLGFGVLAAAICAWTASGAAQVCPAAPAACDSAGKSVFMFKNRNDDNKDKLLFRWLKGAATDTADFADPTATTSTALCLYAGTAASLISEQVVPPGPEWLFGADQKYLFKDPTASADGIRWVLLRSGAAGKARVLVKGRGVDTPDLSLPFTEFPLVVQVHQDDGLPCWGSTFTSATTNHIAKLKAKSP
jgi:hypothetical protein